MDPERDSSSFASLVLLHVPKLCLGWTDLMMLFTLFPGLESSSSGERLARLESRAELVCISDINLYQTNTKDIAICYFSPGLDRGQNCCTAPPSSPVFPPHLAFTAVPNSARGKICMTQTRTIQSIQTFYFQGQGKFSALLSSLH